MRATLGGSDDLNTITSELFGHERGAFSGAPGKRVGLVEFAKDGTLILDELLNLPPHAAIASARSRASDQRVSISLASMVSPVGL